MRDEKIISKDKYSTVIATDNRKYTISQSPSKGIEVIIECIEHQKERSLEARFWIPIGTKSPVVVKENHNEIAIYPVPKKVLEDLQERTKRDLKIGDLAEEAGEEAGKEFYIRTEGYILMTTM